MDAVSVLPAFSQNDYPVYAEEAVVLDARRILGILGLLAGSLASFFGVGGRAATGPAGAAAPAPDPAPAGHPAATPDSVATELASLRSQVARLADEVARLAPPRD